MGASSVIVTQCSLAAIVVVICSTTILFGSIIDRAELFHDMRKTRLLSSWWRRQVGFFKSLAKSARSGPVISASLINGLCGQKTVCLSRLPLGHLTGQAAWRTLPAVIHPMFRTSACQSMPSGIPSTDHASEWDPISAVSAWDFHAMPTESWIGMTLHLMLKHNPMACTTVTRAALMTLFCVTNARPVFHYRDASGLRAAYASYCGQWRVEWPIGRPARVHFCAHDSHAISQDLYPTTFEQRVDKCLQMLAGVIAFHTSNALEVAFPGRKEPGSWVLEYTVKGFTVAHGGRHFYNMIGGNVHEVDYLLMKPTELEMQSPKDIVLYLPNKASSDRDVTLYVPEREAAVLNEALDKLPWTFLSWSVHRGMRDILVAFAKERMDRYRGHLAYTLRVAVAERPEVLDARGWNPHFVRNNMADVAASAVQARQGNSGDAVRVVTEIATVLCGDNLSGLDVTQFWRWATADIGCPVLSPPVVVALVKRFVLEWSKDLDYQMYHDWPTEVWLG